MSMLSDILEKDVHNKFLLSDVDGSESLDIDEYAKGAVFSYSLWMMVSTVVLFRDRKLLWSEFENHERQKCY